MSGPRLKKGKIVISAQHIHQEAAENLVLQPRPGDHFSNGSITYKRETRQPRYRGQWLSGRPQGASDGSLMAPSGAGRHPQSLWAQSGRWRVAGLRH